MSIHFSLRVYDWLSERYTTIGPVSCEGRGTAQTDVGRILAAFPRYSKHIQLGGLVIASAGLIGTAFITQVSDQRHPKPL